MENYQRSQLRHRILIRIAMASIKEMFQFISYWFLTYWYGIIYFSYFAFSSVVSRYRHPQKHLKDRDEMQPSCLTDPIYGCHKFIKVQGVKLHYVESGEENKTLVVLIHGTPGFWFCWRKQIPFLAVNFRYLSGVLLYFAIRSYLEYTREGYKFNLKSVIAVDLRGCGDSDSPTKRGSYSKEIIIKDIVILINSLGCSSAHILCCETSGHIGWELATKHPHLVSKLVFINAPHPLVIQELFHIKSYSYFKYWYLLFLQIPILPEFISSSEATTSWIKSVLEPTIKAKAISSQEIEAYTYTFSRQEDWRGVLNHLRLIDLRPQSEKPQPLIVSASTLLLMGSTHPHFVSEAAYRSAELAERIKIKIIADAGNNLQVTHFKRTNDELQEFLVGSKFAKPELMPKPSATQRSSLVGRMFGAVTSPYAVRSPDVLSISNGWKEAAQNTLNSGKSLAQTVWQGNNKENIDINNFASRNK